MKRLNKIKKCWKQLMLVLAMFLSISASTLTKANALNATLTWGQEIRYPSWLGNWSTKMCYINGSLAYCLESSKDTPPEGQYANSVIDTNEALLKVLYYGYGGPGDVFKDDQVTNDTNKYLYTHIMASYAYSGDIYGGKSWEDLETHGIGLKARYDQIQSMPVPTNEFNFSKSSLNAYYENGQQRTEEIKLNANNDVVVNIPLQDGVELHNLTKGTVNTGTVSVNGGETFYLSTTLEKREDYSSGNLNGKNLVKYAPLVIRSGGNYQDEGTLTTVQDPVTINLNIKWMDVGDFELRKTNDTGKLIDGSEFLLKHTTLDFEKRLVVKDGKLSMSGLPVGEYLLTETKVPDGHAVLQKTFQVTINKDQTTEQIVVNKLRPTGTLEINKSLEASNENAVNKADYDLTKVQFKITANQDIYDSVSLEKLYSKGDAITVGSGKGSNDDVVKLVNGKELENGIYSCDTNGKLSLSGLPMGTYNVEETACPDGFVLDKEVKTVQFAQQNFVTLTYTSSLNINNELTKTVFSKVTADGDNLYGVPMEIVDVKTGKQVHTWISDDNYLEIDGLPVGDYQWREVNAPEGYVLAKPIEFTVKDGDIQDIEMKNFNIEFAKNGNDGKKLLKGGEFQVTSTKTKQITDKWTSGEHIFDVTEDMKAKLMAGETVSDMYVDIEDDSSTYYRISKNEGRDDYRLLMQANGVTEYFNININGDETTHMIRGTVEDQEYVITELKSPDGYATAEPVSFKTNKEQNLTVDMTDEITQFEFYKKDITSQEELEGATLQIKDKNGNIVDEWVSGKTPHKITGLTVGQTYTMIEVIAPVNYKIAQNKEFTVSDTGEVQKITMYDELMPVAKKVKTGDSSNPFSYLVLTGVAVLGMSLVYYRKRKSC
ncbi:SpaA isopeptide-forming pilin-related protein [Thomasclavelia ramosa]|uniref:SpaA isopeptide-forming pilin-related protein n=1 Tax=Thomasclavelia ramosa TaxID=1547 RepID=UPI0022E3A2DD|nr:SpaA isopeptide-forming pilin-related protein [Thomasclavelia ramosa]